MFWQITKDHLYDPRFPWKNSVRGGSCEVSCGRTDAGVTILQVLYHNGWRDEIA